MFSMSSTFLSMFFLEQVQMFHCSKYNVNDNKYIKSWDWCWLVFYKYKYTTQPQYLSISILFSRLLLFLPSNAAKLSLYCKILHSIVNLNLPGPVVAVCRRWFLEGRPTAPGTPHGACAAPWWATLETCAGPDTGRPSTRTTTSWGERQDSGRRVERTRLCGVIASPGGFKKQAADVCCDVCCI